MFRFYNFYYVRFTVYIKTIKTASNMVHKKQQWGVFVETEWSAMLSQLSVSICIVDFIFSVGIFSYIQ